MLALPLPVPIPSRTADENPLGALFMAGRAGDERSYAQALRQCAALLRRFIGPRLQRMAPGLAGDAEDLVQECLLALHLKSHTYDEAQPFEPWLYAVARYKLIDLLRRHQPGRELSFDGLAEDREFADPAEARDPHAGTDLSRLLAELPDKQRRAIELVKLEGRSVLEAASATGQSASAVKVGIHRGLKALARRLAAKGEADADR